MYCQIFGCSQPCSTLKYP